MNTDLNLLIAIAQIAGVFVGFGALISVTDRTGSNLSQPGQIRAVVTIGLVVIVASLIPVGLDRYGVSGHTLWSVCSLIFLLLIWTVTIFSLRMPENREFTRARMWANPMTAVFFWLLLEVPLQIPLVLAVLGIEPHLAPAFYITALVFNLFEAAFVLAQFVYSQQSQPVKTP